MVVPKVFNKNLLILNTFERIKFFAKTHFSGLQPKKKMDPFTGIFKSYSKTFENVLFRFHLFSIQCTYSMISLTFTVSQILSFFVSKIFLTYFGQTI